MTATNPLRFPDSDENGAPKVLIPVVCGTRPEAIKLVPVIVALRDSEDFQPVVVSTGQHHHMVEEIFEQAGIGTHVHLWAGSERASLTERVTTVMRRFNDFCLEWFGPRPDEAELSAAILAGNYPAAVIVHGDTSSAMSAALASFHLQIPVLHVEAGLRTGGSILSPFPEELNRQVITCISALNFAPTQENLENLVRENVEVGQIFVTGNTGIDALRWASTLETPYIDPKVAQLHEGDRTIVLVTAHRRENWGDGLASIADGVGRLASRFPDVQFVVPLHPNPRVRADLGEPLKAFENVLLTEPLEYTSFARLIGRCHFVITDSGGIQEEAPSLDKPVLVARESTERGEGVDAGTLILVDTDPKRIESEGARLLEDSAAYAEIAAKPNPYGDGFAAQRIVNALEYLLTGTNPPVPFGHGFSRKEISEASGIVLPRKPRELPLEEILSDAVEPTGLETWPL